MGPYLSLMALASEKLPRRDGTAAMKSTPASVVHLNSMLSGGGTDDQCVKLAQGLGELGQKVWVAGPGGGEFVQVVRALGLPFHSTPPEGPLKLRFILSAA